MPYQIQKYSRMLMIIKLLNYLKITVYQNHSKGQQKILTNAPYNRLNDKWNQCEVIVMGNKYAIHKLYGKTVNIAIKEFDKIIPILKFIKK